LKTTFWILLVLSAIEFAIAFTMPTTIEKVAPFLDDDDCKTFLYCGEFMHLKHEVKVLIWAVLDPSYHDCMVVIGFNFEEV
jgi:hypothetical protein